MIVMDLNICKYATGETELDDKSRSKRNNYGLYVFPERKGTKDRSCPQIRFLPTCWAKRNTPMPKKVEIYHPSAADSERQSIGSLFGQLLMRKYVWKVQNPACFRRRNPHRASIWGDCFAKNRLAKTFRASSSACVSDFSFIKRSGAFPVPALF